MRSGWGTWGARSPQSASSSGSPCSCGSERPLRSGARQAPGGVQRDPPEAVRPPRVDDGRVAALLVGAALAAAAKGERSGGECQVTRLEEARELDLHLRPVEEEGTQ